MDQNDYELPIPSFFEADMVQQIWKVPYQERSAQAEAWAAEHDLKPAGQDAFKLGLLLVDVQNTFCMPGFELFVAGRSGTGAVEDNIRLCQFIYRNLGILTKVFATMDTHKAMQIFHPIFLVDSQGQHPEPMTMVSYEDVKKGKWKFNPALAGTLGIDPDYGQRHLEHYTQELEERHKYNLTIWPYHAMLGGIGHALVPAVEEAVFFHTIARLSQADFEPKGENSLSEHYSILGPEVIEGPEGKQIGKHNFKFLYTLEKYDALIIAGQAKSHCVSWTISDLLSDIQAKDAALAEKVYLLEDCTSPVVVPGVVDYTEQAEEDFCHFAEAGMHRVKSTDPLPTWPGMEAVFTRS